MPTSGLLTLWQRILIFPFILILPQHRGARVDAILSHNTWHEGQFPTRKDYSVQSHARMNTSWSLKLNVMITWNVIHLNIKTIKNSWPQYLHAEGYRVAPSAQNLSTWFLLPLAFKTMDNWIQVSCCNAMHLLVGMSLKLHTLPMILWQMRWLWENTYWSDSLSPPLCLSQHLFNFYPYLHF